jgi:hypothetical protein
MRRHAGDVAPAQSNHTTVWKLCPAQLRNERGFARAIGPNHCVQLAWLHA